MNKMNTSLPITRELSKSYQLTFIITALVTIVSAVSLIFPESVYPDEEVRQSFLANDTVNLLIAPAILLGSVWLAKQKRLVGLLALPGALIYVLYNASANLFGMPLGIFTLIYLILVGLSAYTAFDIFQKIDREAVKDKLAGNVAEKFGGWVLLVLGALFLVRAVNELIQVFINQQLFSPEISADLIISPMWIFGGVWLLSRKALGYAAGLGLLFSGSMLFIGLLVFFILEPFVNSVPFRVEDFIVIVIMGMICFVPTAFYMRGIFQKG